MRANVTVPEEVEALLDWFVKYDARFEGNLARAVAHFARVGIEAEYARGLAAAETADGDEFAPLAAAQLDVLRSA